jgi:flagellar basal-body rod modification protein FlgD
VHIQGIHPAMVAPLQAQSAQATAAPRSSTNAASDPSTGSSSPSSTSLQETFLNLLVTEMQNQDPTSPVDPTQMVGQLVSLNQLDQLIAINSTLQGLVPPTSTSTTGSTSSSTNSLHAAGPSPLGVTQAAPFNPSLALPTALNQLQPPATGAAATASLMNLYGSMSIPSQNKNISPTGGR